MPITKEEKLDLSRCMIREEYRIALRMRLEGHSYKEIGAQLDISASAAKSRYYAAEAEAHRLWRRKQSDRLPPTWEEAKHLGSLSLTHQTFNALWRQEVYSPKALVETLAHKGFRGLLEFRQIGELRAHEIIDALVEKGYKIPQELPYPVEGPVTIHTFTYEDRKTNIGVSLEMRELGSSMVICSPVGTLILYFGQDGGLVTLHREEG